MYPCQIIKLPEPVRCLTPAWLAATALVSPPTFPPRPERLPGVSRLISTGRTVRSCCSRPAPPAAEAARVPAPAGPGRGRDAAAPGAAPPEAARPLRHGAPWRGGSAVASSPAPLPKGAPASGRDGGEHWPHSGPTAAPHRPTAAPQRPYIGPT